MQENRSVIGMIPGLKTILLEEQVSAQLRRIFLLRPHASNLQVRMGVLRFGFWRRYCIYPQRFKNQPHSQRSTSSRFVWAAILCRVTQATFIFLAQVYLRAGEEKVDARGILISSARPFSQKIDLIGPVEFPRISENLHGRIYMRFEIETVAYGDKIRIYVDLKNGRIPHLCGKRQYKTRNVYVKN